MMYLQIEIELPANCDSVATDWLEENILHPDLKFDDTGCGTEVVARYKSDQVPELRITVMWIDKKKLRDQE